jgi:hypothetical protein
MQQNGFIGRQSVFYEMVQYFIDFNPSTNGPSHAEKLLIFCPFLYKSFLLLKSTELFLIFDQPLFFEHPADFSGTSPERPDKLQGLKN